MFNIPGAAGWNITFAYCATMFRELPIELYIKGIDMEVLTTVSDELSE